jgi:predicted nucleotide-binding protein
MAGLPPYDKPKLRQLGERLGKLIATDPRDHQAVQAIPKTLDAVCASLGTWLKHNAVPRGAAYQKTLVEIRVELAAARYPSTDTLLKLVNRAGLLVKRIDEQNLNVFIVHGRDESMRDDVQSVLTSLQIPSLVLVNEMNRGQTIIEKFEAAASQCEFAVVLCSADDMGGLKPARGKPPEYQGRARQNVVLELGYFLAALGRDHLFILHPKSGLEAPSDFAGVGHSVYEPGGHVWRRQLLRELKEVGAYVDPKVAERL